MPILTHHAGGAPAAGGGQGAAGKGDSPAHLSQSRVLSPAHVNALLQEEDASLQATLAKFNGGWNITYVTHAHMHDVLSVTLTPPPARL